ncbi:MAG: adenylate/guanylate cyclase domain-containing protein [Alphaproteobacteria bacterium]|nr:adenylate/guanylate cyclase domain-containing protein [Alphaproteobacteria bacterium]
MTTTIALDAWSDLLDTGLAVADPATWRVVCSNARFRTWAGDTTGAALDGLLRGFKPERATAALAGGRAYSVEVEVGSGARTQTLRVTVRPAPPLGDGVALVECADVTPRRRAEMMLDSYSKMAERNARELQREKERVEKLLLNVMPRGVYEELKDSGVVSPQRVEAASVLMLDFVGFTELAISSEASALVSELNDIFSALDRIVELFGCERIKTIGDGYLAIAGMPENGPDDARQLCKAAIRMRRYLERRNAAHPNQWQCRIGIATGPLIGSLVGVQKYVYDVFGPTVNLAARLEGLCGPMEISISEATADRLGQDFLLEDLGDVELKGLPPTRAYRLLGEQGGSQMGGGHSR